MWGLISILELLQIQKSQKKMFKNISLQHLILQKAHRQILTIVTRDRINDASFRQKLDPTSKNPLELVFEDISTFDAENPIVGSLLREIDLNKKQTDVILSSLYLVILAKSLKCKSAWTGYEE